MNIVENKAFLNGKFLGNLKDEEIWNGNYKGEIFQENRIVFDTTKSSDTKCIPGEPCADISPNIPCSKCEIMLPSKYRDIDIEKNSFYS